MQIKNIIRYKMLYQLELYHRIFAGNSFYMHIPLFTYCHLWWLMITMFGLIFQVCTDRLLPLPSCIGQN